MVGLKQVDDVACFQHRNPFPGGAMGDATICGQGRKIEQLTGTGGTHPEKALKTGQVADVEQATNIALQVGIDVIGEPDRGGMPSIRMRG